MIDRFERFSFAISEIDRCWHKIAAAEMAPYGLRGPYAVYFTTLQRNPDGLTAAQLSELCSRDKADVSRAVAVLQKKGLVTKQGANHYRALLRLTPQGEELAAHIAQKAHTAVQYGGRGISDEQRAVFYAALERICINLQELSRNGL